MNAQVLQRQLTKVLPPGHLVDTTWFERQGFDKGLVRESLKSGLLEQLSRGLYFLPSDADDEFVQWGFIVDALQRIKKLPVHVGGRAALEIVGHVHYIRMTGPLPVNLYSYSKLPSWITKVPSNGKFSFHSAGKLFDPGAPGLRDYDGPYTECKITISTKERAFCELLDEVPKKFDFHHSDMLLELARLMDPKKIQSVLEACKSVKVKRLFLFFAERHQQKWLRKLKLDRIDLGSGPRQIEVGGMYDSKYMITVPEDLDEQAGHWYYD